MRNTYALIGMTTLLVIAGAWYALKHDSSTGTRTNASKVPMALTLTSTAFAESGSIPSQFTCDAENVSPPLSIANVPEKTQSLALIVTDLDVPKQFNTGGEFVHWIAFNIPPDTESVAQGQWSGIPGANGLGKPTYTGPCPPREYEPSEHRYLFKLYALDVMLDLAPGASEANLRAAMEGHIIAEAQLLGRYKRIAE